MLWEGGECAQTPPHRSWPRRCSPSSFAFQTTISPIMPVKNNWTLPPKVRFLSYFGPSSFLYSI